MFTFALGLAVGAAFAPQVIAAYQLAKPWIISKWYKLTK